MPLRQQGVQMKAFRNEGGPGFGCSNKARGLVVKTQRQAPLPH